MHAAIQRARAETAKAFTGRTYSWETLRDSWSPCLTFPNISIDVIRHGETPQNKQRVVTGQADVELTPIGERQARETARLLQPPYDFAVSSTLKRARRTVELALEAAHLDLPVLTDPRLNERSLGVLEGRPSHFIEEFASGDLDFAPADGDSYRLVAQRVMSFLVDLSALAATLRERRVLIASHMGPMRVLVGVLRGERDPREMMGYSFRNTQLLHFALEHIEWPPFLETTTRQGRPRSRLTHALKNFASAIGTRSTPRFKKA